jgi:hypothetical protein
LVASLSNVPSAFNLYLWLPHTRGRLSVGNLASESHRVLSALVARHLGAMREENGCRPRAVPIIDKFGSN